jgi:hypothetical protein
MSIHPKIKMRCIDCLFLELCEDVGVDYCKYRDEELKFDVEEDHSRIAREYLEGCPYWYEPTEYEDRTNKAIEDKLQKSLKCYEVPKV